MRANLRVLIIGPSTTILGGQALQAQRLIQGLRETANVEVGFLPINPALPGPLRVFNGMKFVRPVVKELVYWAQLIAALPRWRVLHILSASYSSFWLSPVPALFVGKLYGKRMALNYRSGEADDHLSRSPLAKALVKRFHTIIVPSGYLVDVFQRHGLEARSIPNIVDFDQFRFRARDPLRPVFVSNRNLDPLYNVGCILRAYALISKRHPGAELHIAGDGSQRPHLKDMAASLRLPNVVFHGKLTTDEMSALLDRCDIMLNSPNIDNMPSSLLEAQACGLPVVTTNAGGIPYIVKHEESGMLVPCNDHRALADAALRVLADPALAARIIQGGQRSVQICQSRDVASQWLKVYEALAGAGAEIPAASGRGRRAVL
jgi:glycosyltransferase involved in cell wall biosynthesis